MLTLIGTILGFVGGFIPELLKLWKAKGDREHELAVMKMQMDAQAAGHAQRLEEINTQADISEQQIALQASKVEKLELSGKWWVDIPATFVNALLTLAIGLVRPTITYCFFWLYAMVKYAKWTVAQEVGTDKMTAIIQLWDAEDSAVFGTVIGFWFGSRTAKYMYERQK